MSELTTTSVKVNGHACRVWKKGSGPKLGFLAGFGGLPKWIPFLDELAKTREVIVPSLPGFPGATGHRELETHLEWALAARDLLQGAGLDGADLIGSSVGGGLAAEVAAIWPESVRRLVLIAPFGIFNSRGNQADPWAQRPDLLPNLLVAKPELFAELRKAPADLANPAEWQVEQIRAIEASARLFFPLGDKGLAKRLGRISAPTLLLWGSEDRVLPPGHAGLFANGIRVGKELRIIANAGHLAELDEPGSTAAAALEWVRHGG